MGRGGSSYLVNELILEITFVCETLFTFLKVSDWAGSAYIFADISIDMLHKTLLLGDALDADEDLYDDVKQSAVAENKQVLCSLRFFFFYS